MRISLALPLLLCAAFARAATFPMPGDGNDLVGAIVIVKARQKDTLVDIARRHDVGQEAILSANPDVDRWLPGTGTDVVLPRQFILPPTAYTGVVLNLPEMRVYYYPKPGPDDRAVVYTYPVGIGRMDWATPLGATKVLVKDKDPVWRPPESIRREHALEGDPLPAVVPAGPNNPLGGYALRLGIPGYLMHGTNKEFGVGMRVSHGCVRLLPEDIEELFGLVSVGTPVRIINQPVKAGWFDGELYLEVHPPLEEDAMGEDGLYEMAMAALDAAQFGRPARLDLQVIGQAIANPSGMPVAVSH